MRWMSCLRGAALAAILGSPPAFAQNAAPLSPTGPSAVPAGSTGATIDGGLPARAASTTVVGRTKPPGAAAPGTRPDLEEKSRRLDRRINQGICTGCK